MLLQIGWSHGAAKWRTRTGAWCARGVEPRWRMAFSPRAVLKTLVGRSNSITAHVLAHLAEVDACRAYLEVACPSLYKYCIYELRISEDKAQRRVQAARSVLLDMLTNASIHLTGILLLAPYAGGTGRIDATGAKATQRRRGRIHGRHSRDSRPRE